MICLDDVTIRAGAFLLSGVSLTVPAGQYAVLMGKTGCGKTTLLEAVCGLRTVVSGSITLCGRDVTRLRPAERGIGYVPQDTALFSTMTVHDHLAFAPRLRRWSRRDIESRVAELAELLGIVHLLHRKPDGLSGGEAQRVALGRALSFQPRVLCLDEPLSALDQDTRHEMHALLASVKQRFGMTVLHVTHDRDEAARLGDRLFTLADGNIGEVENPGHGNHLSGNGT